MKITSVGTKRLTCRETSRRHAVADRFNHLGVIGALLRREGIYYSQLATWRKNRATAYGCIDRQHSPGECQGQ